MTVMDLHRRFAPLLRHERLLVALLALALFLPGIGARDLWNPDEPRYAQVAREMLASGEFLVPHLNGRIYSEKPPLQFWAIALCGAARGGVDEVAARLPAVFAAVAATLLLFALGRRLFDRETAWIAAAVFATSGKILLQGRIGQIDMLLIALVTAAMYCWTRGLLEHRAGWYRLFFLFCGLATVAKGPVGLLPPLLAIVVFALVAGRRELLRELRIGRGLLLWAAPVAAWLLPAALRAGPAYLATLVLRQNLERYADPWHHFQPWYYYLQILPGDFFPWSLLLPGALVAGWRTLRGERRERFVWALCWVVVTLVFFSLSPGKRTVYILTMYPGLALALAAGLGELRRSWPRGRAWLEAPLLLLATVAGLAPLALPRLATRNRTEISLLGGWLVPATAVLLLLFAAAALLAWRAARRGRIGAAVGSLAAGTAAVALVAVTTILPAFDLFKSARSLSAELLARAAPAEPYAIWPRLDATFLFYTGRFSEPLATEAELRAFAARPERVWLLARRDELARLTPPLPLVEIARDADPRRGYILLSQVPPAPAGEKEERR